MNKLKLVVGYPWSSPFTFTDFTDSMLELSRPDDCEVKFVRGRGWCPARRHISICEQALELGADLICIVGTDQTYEPDLLERLVRRFKEGHEIVAALVPCRGYVAWQPMKPFQPMAWRFKSNLPNEYRDYRGQQLDGDMIEIISREHGGMQRVNFIGSGVLMFHRDHLLSLKKPWFQETVRHEDYVRVANMDCTFVWRLQEEAGATVWVDTEIMVKHLNVFAIDDTYQDRFDDWTKPGEGNPEVCNFDAPVPETAGAGT